MKPLRVLQITDLHFPAEAHHDVHGIYPDAHLAALLPDLIDYQPDLAVLTGDLADAGEPGAYRRLGTALSQLDCKKIALPGNHDDPAIMGGILRDHGIDMPGHLDSDGWRLTLLDSVVPREPGGLLQRRELERLRGTLEQAPERHHLIFVHHHPVPVDSPWIDSQRLANGTELLSVLESYPRVVALCWGHIHHLWETSHGAIQLLGTPATAGQARPRESRWVDDDFGPRCRWLELGRDGRLDTGIIEARNRVV